MADNIDVTPGTGKTVATDDVGGVQFQKIKIDVGGDGVSEPLSSTNTIPATIYSGGTAVDWSAPVPVTQSGTWNIGNISGTVTLPVGAATEASLGKLSLAQGSTTAGQSGPLIQGAVTTAPPSYTNAQTSPLSLTGDGGLRVDVQASALPSGAANSANQLSVIGAKSAGAAASNSVLVGAAYNSVAPSLTDGQQASLQAENTGQLKVSLFCGGAALLAFPPADDASAPNVNALYTTSVISLANGASTYERARSIVYSFGSSTGVTAVEAAGSSWRRIAANQSVTNIKNSAGILHKVIINTKGASSNVLSLYDTATNTTGTPIAVIDTTGSTQCFVYDLGFTNGIAAGLTTGAAADITIVYR